MVEKQGNQAAGGKQGRKPWTLREIGGKTLWDWLQLLIVPVVLSLITVAFALWQDTRQERVENQRAKAERKLAELRAQDEALQAYLDQMGQLILDWKLGEDEQCFTCHRAAPLAQARTSTVILRLDAQHNESVTRFLSTSKLTWSSTTSPIPGVREFPEGLLSGIALSDAKLSGTWLPNADLTFADLGGADLSNAVLTDADLTDADLKDANLHEAILIGTDLSDTDLSGADLSGAEGITNEELEQQAGSLKAATMPSGQKYEELKGKEERGEDGKKGSPS